MNIYHAFTLVTVLVVFCLLSTKRMAWIFMLSAFCIWGVFVALRGSAGADTLHYVSPVFDPGLGWWTQQLSQLLGNANLNLVNLQGIIYVIIGLVLCFADSHILKVAVLVWFYYLSFGGMIIDTSTVRYSLCFLLVFMLWAFANLPIGLIKKHKASIYPALSLVLISGYPSHFLQWAPSLLMATIDNLSKSYTKHKKRYLSLFSVALIVISFPLYTILRRYYLLGPLLLQYLGIKTSLPALLSALLMSALSATQLSLLSRRYLSLRVSLISFLSILPFSLIGMGWRFLGIFLPFCLFFGDLTGYTPFLFGSTSRSLKLSACMVALTFSTGMIFLHSYVLNSEITDPSPIGNYRLF
jgi:hypothetical protein